MSRRAASQGRKRSSLQQQSWFDDFMEKIQKLIHPMITKRMTNKVVMMSQRMITTAIAMATPSVHH
jgi:hypothetical protein